MVGNMDDVELLIDVERTFGITITDEVAQSTITVGDLEKAVVAELAKNPAPDLLWALILRIVRNHSGHKGHIDRETTFFAERAKRRNPDG